MKKTAAILLSGILLFNLIGYRLLTFYLEDRANARLELQLDNNDYKETSLISIKVPATLPYYTNNAQYDRVDGEIEIRGIHYNYVKRRLYNDSLEYLCIPNTARTKLSNARDNFFKLVNDLQHPSQNKKGGNDTSGGKENAPEYWQSTYAWNFPALEEMHPGDYTFYQVRYLNPSLSPQEQPPDAV